MKPFWKSKTFWANLIAIALYVAKQYGLLPDGTPDINPAALAAANVALRFLTKGPVNLTGA